MQKPGLYKVNKNVFDAPPALSAFNISRRGLQRAARPGSKRQGPLHPPDPKDYSSSSDGDPPPPEPDAGPGARRWLGEKGAAEHPKPAARRCWRLKGGKKRQREGGELLRGTGDGCRERDSKIKPTTPGCGSCHGDEGEAAPAGPGARIPPGHAPQKQALVLSSSNPERSFAFLGFIGQETLVFLAGGEPFH